VPQAQALGDVDFQQLSAAYADLVTRFNDGSFSYDRVRRGHFFINKNNPFFFSNFFSKSSISSTATKIGGAELVDSEMTFSLEFRLP